MGNTKAPHSPPNPGSIPDFVIAIPIGPDEGDLLTQTLRSIAGQAESVGVAVCSCNESENIRAICETYSDIIAYSRFGPDEGQTAAINEGWGNVPGAVYSWLNVDDVLAPGTLSLVKATLEQNSEIDVIHGASLILQDARIHKSFGADPVTEALLYANTISQPSCFVRRRALDDLEGPLDEDLHYAMDWDFWIRLFEKGRVFSAVSQPLSLVRWYSDTKTARFSFRKYREYYRCLRRNVGIGRSMVTLVNTAIHNLATYGRAKWLFYPAHAGLKALSRSRANDGASDMAGVPNDMFHYEDNPVKPVIDFTSSFSGKISFGEDSLECESTKRIVLPVMIEPATTLHVVTDPPAAMNLAFVLETQEGL